MAPRGSQLRPSTILAVIFEFRSMAPRGSQREDGAHQITATLDLDPWLHEGANEVIVDKDSKGNQFRSMAPRGSQPFKNCIENYVSVKFISLYLIILKNTRMKRERVIFSVYYR